MTSGDAIRAAVFPHVQAALETLARAVDSAEHGGRVLPRTYHAPLSGPLTELAALREHEAGGSLPDASAEIDFRGLAAALGLDLGAYALLTHTPGVARGPWVNVPNELGYQPGRLAEVRAALERLRNWAAPAALPSGLTQQSEHSMADDSARAAYEQLRQFLAYLFLRDVANERFVRVTRQQIAEQAHALGLDVSGAIGHAEQAGWLVQWSELPSEYSVSHYVILGEVNKPPADSEAEAEAATGVAPAAAEPADDAGGDYYAVTLSQVAALVNKSKRTLEGWAKDDPDFPLPDVEGGGGKAAYWKWSRMRPYLEMKTRRTLPERFPSDSLRPGFGDVEP